MVQMDKFPSIKYPNDEETNGVLGDEVVVTEKLDGANFRFTFNSEGNIVCGSRNVKFTENGEPLPIEEINCNFRHAIEYLRDVTEGWAIEEGWSTDLVFYGEAMHLHSLEYDDIDYEQPQSGSPHPGGSVPNVVLFDISRKVGTDDDGNPIYEWVNWDEFEDIIEHSPFESTRVLHRFDPTVGDDRDHKPKLEIPEESMFGGHPEGVVVRRVDGLVRAKKVSEDFKEKNAQAFNDPSKAQGDAAEFVAMFVTDARIEKMVHKLVDRGQYDQIEMPMMEDLPLEVIRDVLEEEAMNLFMDEYGFEAEFDSEFKYEIRSKVSDMCSRKLRGMCQEF